MEVIVLPKNFREVAIYACMYIHTCIHIRTYVRTVFVSVRKVKFNYVFSYAFLVFAEVSDGHFYRRVAITLLLSLSA